ncbi:hypothetical protein DFH11DRAFT_1610961 [Phellopilus nigrolimitatus]|nr:hypothetical protein DFH11DRAFT_1610961 [Phellopilus nigrolimitatus]
MANLRKLTVNADSWPIHAFDFHQLWCLPNLKCLESTNVVLKPVFRQNLSYCHFRFIGFFLPNHLKVFLQSSPSLETVEIEIDDVFIDDEDDEDSDDEDDNVQEDPSSRVSSIKYFSFTIIERASIPFARRVLEFSYPNVTEMSITILHSKWCCENHSNIHWRRRHLLRAMRHFPMVKKLRLRLLGSNTYDVDFSSILFRMPQSLESLQFEAPGHTLSMDGCGFALPRLRTLHFRNCDKMDLKFIEAVRDNFNRVVENVEVVCCHPIEEENVRGAFPSSKVIWLS